MMKNPLADSGCVFDLAEIFLNKLSVKRCDVGGVNKCLRFDKKCRNPDSELTWAVIRPRFSLCKSVWLHDEFAHGGIVFKSSSNLEIVNRLIM